VQERGVVSSDERFVASTSGRDWLDEAMRTDASLMYLPGQVRATDGEEWVQSRKIDSKACLTPAVPSAEGRFLSSHKLVVL
jgi:hypothetical protein